MNKKYYDDHHRHNYHHHHYHGWDRRSNTVTQYTRLATRLRRSARWKCLETGEMKKTLEPSSHLTFQEKRPNPLNMAGVTEFGKCLETGEMTKSFEYGRGGVTEF